MSNHVSVLLATSHKFWLDDRADRKTIIGLCNFLRHWGANLEIFYVGALDRRDRRVLRKNWQWVRFRLCKWKMAAPENEPPLSAFRCARAEKRFATICRRRHPDFIIVEYIRLAYLVQSLPAELRARSLTMVNTHDVMCDRYARFRAAGRSHWAVIEEEDEKEALDAFDVIMAIQERDAERFRELAPGKRVITIGHVPDIVKHPARGSGDIVVAYIATQAIPNRVAVEWFLKEIWPVVRERSGGKVRMVIAGSLCGRMPTGLPMEGVRLLGYVEDLGAVYRDADIVVNPVTFGGGLKRKNTEALCNGKPLVTTTVGAEGLEDGVGRAFFVCDTAAEMAEQLCALVADRDLRGHMTESAYTYAETHFTESAVFGVLSQVMNETRNDA